MERKLDWIYDWVDGLMRDGRFGELDRMLDTIIVDDHQVDELLGYLTATLPAKGKLTARPKFCQDVERVLKTRGIWEPGLLKGLE